MPIPPRPIPRHLQLFRVSVPGAGICAPRGRPPGNLVHEVLKPSQVLAFKMLVLFLRDGSFCGKRYGLHDTMACPRSTGQVVEIFRGEFLIIESFPVLYRSNYLSYIIYLKTKETYAANKECISHSTNTE